MANRSSPGVLQCDDGEDGPPVHATHAGTVTHEVVVDGGTVRADLGERHKVRQPSLCRPAASVNLIFLNYSMGTAYVLCTPHIAVGTSNKKAGEPSY